MIVKICGIRRDEEISYLNAVRPDLAGFILVPGRRRYVSPEKVSELRQHLDKDIKVVGVFVDEDNGFRVTIIFICAACYDKIIFFSIKETAPEPV